MLVKMLNIELVDLNSGCASVYVLDDCLTFGDKADIGDGHI